MAVASWLVFGCGLDRIDLRPLALSEEGLPPEVEPPASSPEPGGEAASATEPPPRDEPAMPGGIVAPSDEVPVTPEVLLRPGPGCQKLDLLFVIDNSRSMRDEQDSLARSFPNFIDVVEQVLDATDFHIMVVSTGGDRHDEDEPALDPEACDEIQGAGKRSSADGEDCGIAGGLSYMADGQPNLADTFSCMARVGTDGSAFEEPMDAALAATSDALNAVGRCNAGFLRRDAILVVTLVTDEEDRASTGDPEDWRRALLGLKGGNEDALVVLGLVGDNNVDGGLLGGKCAGSDADGAPRLQQFVEGLNGVLGSVCAEDYTPFFQTAVGAIDRACGEFVPPIGL